MWLVLLLWLWLLLLSLFFFFNDTATTEIYTLSLHDALPICATRSSFSARRASGEVCARRWGNLVDLRPHDSLQPVDLIDVLPNLQKVHGLRHAQGGEVGRTDREDKGAHSVFAMGSPHHPKRTLSGVTVPAIGCLDGVSELGRHFRLPEQVGVRCLVVKADVADHLIVLLAHDGPVQPGMLRGVFLDHADAALQPGLPRHRARIGDGEAGGPAKDRKSVV